MNKPKKGGLGKGLAALMPSTKPTNEAQTSGVIEDKAGNSVGELRMMDRNQMLAGKYQPRSHMDESALAELAQSIAQQGVMQPIVVRKIPSGQYEIIAGERRYRAAGLAGLDEVPVLIRDIDDESALQMALIENIQREDLNPLEEAQGLARLISEFHYTHETCAQAIGRSRSAVSNLLRLLNLAPPVQTMLLAGDIEMGHARALLSLQAGEQVMLAQEVSNKKLSVREIEKRVQQWGELVNGEARSAKVKVTNPDIDHLQNELSDLLGAEVVIQMQKKNMGKLVINFSNLDVLEGILQKIKATGQ